MKSVRSLPPKKITKHRLALEEIADDPKVIGIGYVTKVYVELPIYKDLNKYRGQIICEPDLIIQDMFFNNYLIEYKCNDSRMQREKAQKQLLTAQRVIKEYFNKDIHRLLYVHEHFNVEELEGGRFKDFKNG